MLSFWFGRQLRKITSPGSSFIVNAQNMRVDQYAHLTPQMAKYSLKDFTLFLSFLVSLRNGQAEEAAHKTFCCFYLEGETLNVCLTLCTKEI